MASKKTRKGDKSGNAQDADSDESARDDAPTPTHEMYIQYNFVLFNNTDYLNFISSGWPIY